MLTSCVSPAQHFAKVATEQGFSESSIKGQPFEHRLYSSNITAQSQKKVLHVYLDGDGTPWRNEMWASDDPTSRNSMILLLMAQDTAPSLLLGRPCYHGLSASAFCDESLWTSKRYAAEVVASMAAALNNWLKLHPFNKVVLIGYSGGGSLAVLMADKITQVDTVVTFAANLDVDAWSKALGYPTLPESLNPIKEKKLPSRIKQLHFAGAEDDIVPAFVIKSYADQQDNAKYYLMPTFNHQCCWQQQWQKILQLFLKE